MEFKLGDKIATREGYGKTLVELGADHDFVVLDADLAEATKTCYFGKAYPNRFFDCGIAEGNMVGIAAGLAAAGKTVVASSFAMFAAGRAFEQIRNSVAYPHLNVKICATHAGITVGEDGATHQCLEDIALMRSIPGMTVINPSDAAEAAAALQAEKGVSVRVVNIHTIKPLDGDIVKKAAAETGAIVVAEEHNVIGGLGSAVAECVTETCPCPVLRVGVQDTFGRSGKVPPLLELYGLTAEAIIEKAEAALALKAAMGK